MERNILKVEITTPQKKWQFDETLAIKAPGVKGSFQVLYNHAPLMSQLEIGEVKLETSDGISMFATSGGFLEVLDNRVSLLLESCEKADSIDVERAEKAAERARTRLESGEETVDAMRAEAALARAMNRIKIARKSKNGAQ